jgi:peptidoglycan/xylan/chitin deacetylase (PgdA/CDA1 family)
MYIPILAYHRLMSQPPKPAVDPWRIAVSTAQFRSHLAWLSRWGYRTVPLPEYVRQLRGGQAPARKSFAITFDDGYEEVLTLALPLLQEFHFTATIFAVPGQLGGSNVWDDGQHRLLSADQLRALQQAGMTLGAHTCGHPHLTRMEADAARREIRDSRKFLEEIIRQPVTHFAYPYGECSPSVEALAREAGFEAAFATDRAPRDHEENLFRIRRVVVFPRTNAWELFWKMQAWYPAYQDWKRRE